ncbi:MAG: hypothetical protein RLY58_801 [Pseudomonadota bacterium]|jgi:hypothetical protein
MRLLVLLAGLALPIMASVAYAATPANAVEFKNALPTTMEELATVDILNEICPPILGTGMDAGFQSGYIRLLNELLPNIDTPALAIRTLKDDPEYIPLLEQARQDAKSVSVDENRQVCLDVVHYPMPNAKK